MKKTIVAVAIVVATFAAQAQEAQKKIKSTIPEFTLACGAIGHSSLYRIVSKKGEIYYASILNEANIKFAKKSFDIKITDREIYIKMKSGRDDTIYYVNLDRSTLNAEEKYFVSKYAYPPDGFSSFKMSCQKIEDSSVYEVIKRGYESALAESQEKKRTDENAIQEKKRAYENRLNKI